MGTAEFGEERADLVKRELAPGAAGSDEEFRRQRIQSINGHRVGHDSSV